MPAQGRESFDVLDCAGIAANKNGIPFDTEKITPAVTTRGMKEEHMMEIADLIHRALGSKDSNAELEKIRTEVRALTARYPQPR